MTANYPRIERWKIPAAAIGATLRGVLRAAANRHEGGSFWLGARAAVAEVQTVVLLEGPGVIEERGFWDVSPIVYGVVGQWAGRHNQVLLGVVHSHQGRKATWLSSLDRRQGVRVPDLLAVVVPGFGSVRDPRQWGIHRFDGDDFDEFDTAELDACIDWTDGDLAVVTANENGIHV